GYRGRDGWVRNARHTLAVKGDAQGWLTLVESEIIRGDWWPPEAGKVMLSEYAGRWIAERKLQPRSRELYAGLLANHLEPYLGQLTLDKISPPVVRRWRAPRLEPGGARAAAAPAGRVR